MPLTIDQIREKAVPIAKQYGVKKLALFGSYAKGTATDESDVDFVMDKGEIRGYLDYMRFVFALEKRFQKHVDLVCYDDVPDSLFLKDLHQSEVFLYES